MAISWWSSPAKLNLFLHITGRYENGYHALQTVFQMLDTGDELGFEVPSGSSEIVLQDAIAGVDTEDNLIFRAARMLKMHANIALGAHIRIRKHLPMGGGVGGGSSNAATTLLVLNKLWRANLSEQALIQIGSKLGADVPVFIHGKTTFAQGTGDIFSPITTPKAYYLVVHPNIHVATEDIFTLPELPRNTPVIAAKDYLFNKTRNDCQEIVCQRHPQVAKLLQWLVHYAPSRMTGTGACVFAVFDNKEKAEEVFATLPEQWSGFVAQGVTESPLLKQLKNSDKQ